MQECYNKFLKWLCRNFKKDTNLYYRDIEYRLVKVGTKYKIYVKTIPGFSYWRLRSDWKELVWKFCGLVPRLHDYKIEDCYVSSEDDAKNLLKSHYDDVLKIVCSKF